MKTFNLVYPDKSDINYKLMQFPDGQQSIIIDGLKINRSDDYVLIKTRLNDFKDLEVLICATQALRGLKVSEIHLYCPYFLGSRSDRKFEDGSVNYLKEVICPIINGLNFASVTVMDPHSDVLEACLDNFSKVDNKELVKEAIGRKKDIVLLSPDAGALKKIHKLSQFFNIEDVICCSKNRDVHGQLTRTIVPIHGKQHSKDIFIIDDICDGGATFINIIREIRKQQESFKTPPNKIYLVVTHGIFSKGFSELNKYFDGIYCTNSYKDITDYPTIGGPINLKQLNIFN
jgi:ribose-phosphate pyrophosphokinase